MNNLIIPVANLGVAYSKHIVHIFSYHGADDLRNHLEVLLYIFLMSFSFVLSLYVYAYK